MSMQFEEVKQWATVLGIGGIVGSILTLWVKAALENRTEERRKRREDESKTRDNRIDTDRATYNQRITILIRSNLAAYIRSGKWYSDEEDLKRLVASLAQGTYEHFLDPAVNDLWMGLIRKSVQLANKRMVTGLAEADIREYNRIRREWEDSAKRSFGPLPETPGFPVPRHTPRDHPPDLYAA